MFKRGGLAVLLVTATVAVTPAASAGAPDCQVHGPGDGKIGVTCEPPEDPLGPVFTLVDGVLQEIRDAVDQIPDPQERLKDHPQP